MERIWWHSLQIPSFDPSVLCCERNFTEALVHHPLLFRTEHLSIAERQIIPGCGDRQDFPERGTESGIGNKELLALYDDPLPLPPTEGKWELHALKSQCKSRFKLYKAKYYKYPKLQFIASSAERDGPMVLNKLQARAGALVWRDNTLLLPMGSEQVSPMQQPHRPLTFTNRVKVCPVSTWPGRNLLHIPYLIKGWP